MLLNELRDNPHNSGEATSQKPEPSFRSRPESSLFSIAWTLACASVTDLTNEFLNVTKGAQMAALLKNAVKEMMKEGKPALGMIARLGRCQATSRASPRRPATISCSSTAKHALYSVETTGHIAQAALGCGVVPMARVRSCDDPDTQVLLDNGVMGIVFPDINTAAEAKRASITPSFRPSAAARYRAATRCSISARCLPPTRSPRSTKRRWSCAWWKRREEPRQRRCDCGGRRRRRHPRRIQRFDDVTRQARPVQARRRISPHSTKYSPRPRSMASLPASAATAMSSARSSLSAKARVS